MKILIADDNAVSRVLLQKNMEKSGFEVICAANGREAVNYLRAADGPRLAILGWVMSEMDGPTVCRELRASASNPHVYLILHSSRNSPEDVVFGLEAGADDYLIKPCTPQEIRARVRVGQRVLELQDRLVRDAHHDSLTGLPNRSFFRQRLTDNIRNSIEDPNYRFALLFVDIDRFKLINDSFGHLSGDALMLSVAQRLLQAVRTEDLLYRLKAPRRSKSGLFDVVARIGGDEFVILLADIFDIENGTRVAQRIQSALEPAFHIGTEEIVITASIGIAMNDQSSPDASDILRRADAAMYKAKMLGKARYEVGEFAPETNETHPFKLERELRRAVDNREFIVHYQPIIGLTDCRIRGFEALVRWRHPELGMVQPGNFIGTAEDSGLIVAIGNFVLREACKEMQRWNSSFDTGSPLTICVNVSPRQFEPKKLVKCVQEALRDSGLDSECLELEVTENLTMEDAVRASKILSELTELGVSLSLDDFGTGYSSLSYLIKLPIHTLKIDRSFIAELGKRGETREIVQAIISLAHHLGMKVIAEGVENQQQFELVRQMGCDMAQGFLFSCPVEAKNVDLMLSTADYFEALVASATDAA